MNQGLSKHKIIALKDLHFKRTARTESLLHDALERMVAGTPKHLSIPYLWTKKNFAKESGVHISTLLRRKANRYIWAEIIDKFDTLQKAARKSTLAPTTSTKSITAASKAEIKAMEHELARQAEEICRLNDQIREYQQRSDDIKNLMIENAQLRKNVSLAGRSR